MSKSVVLSSYLGLSWVLGPVYRFAIRRRLAGGKEDKARVAERFGGTTLARPDGPLIWMHAASIGETQSLMGLIPALLAAQPGLSILVTSTTVTSARLLERDLPERAFHQFSPIDTPQVIRQFLDHWQPDVAVWVESEIWPRMLVDTKARGIPMMLINARVSAKTIERWSWVSKTARLLFSKFDTILAQDQSTLTLLEKLELNDVALRMTGSLKQELAPPLQDVDEIDALEQTLRGRSVWVAASTHPGEEDVLLEAHKHLATDAVMILVPRHPERGDALAAQARAAGWVVAQRSKGEPLTADTQVYLADTIGEMGLWYRLSKVSFIAGSLEPIGGHNPFEPILLESAVISGSQVGNFADVYARLKNTEGAVFADTSTAIAEAVIALFDEDTRAQQAARALDCLASNASITAQVRDHVLAAIKA
ncbi:3-deoxy-D-manno-octulosonic acid transferase [Cognatishimia sp. 1_MG-2023]|uniref:3-deoxy-D-manno-octulosonic acid transferase n=1 Tax=Cognatishimia sp. 1_MG-2023 TaxID=3062642 RepID=UPI0026E1B51F|nr:3-deoxy-D-manno-octulosonic acid transferase [Cognatishimia sp. 1_MG-2023]MDO6727982.1 3-deoxy-D-manno-octulosonic acid transferase [Cognatishimia sp. 1_MG-2023]